MTKIRQIFDLLWREVAKFGAVGITCWIIDSGLYALLWHGPMSDSTVKAKIVSTVVSVLCAWFANRHWTFRHRKGERPWKEFAMFLLVNGFSLAVIVSCQLASRHVLGLTSFMADFIAGSVIGMILATMLRFFAYRYFVFNQELDAEPGFEHDHEILSHSSSSHSRNSPTGAPKIIPEC